MFKAHKLGTNVPSTDIQICQHGFSLSKHECACRPSGHRDSTSPGLERDVMNVERKHDQCRRIVFGQITKTAQVTKNCPYM